MLLKSRLLGLEAKKYIVILNKADAAELDVKPLDRVEIFSDRKKVIAIVNVAEKFIKKGTIGLYSRVSEDLKVKDGEEVKVVPALPPKSIAYIRKKLSGLTLKKEEIREIVEDVVQQKLSDIELTSFVTALYERGMTMEEAASLSMAMAETGKSLNLKRTVYDKHSIGGVPGDKTSILLVPIIAASGLTIPKTSSRSITSPAGTADRMECLCPVELSMEEIKRVVLKTNGCLVWGGAVELAPADDIFIRIEYPLSIDPLLLPSVMSKKKAVRAKYLVIDIPTGRGAKVKTIGEANELAKQFIELGKRLGIKVACVSTFGEQPIGHGIGPALEAREALLSLQGKCPQDLLDKVVSLAEVLLKFAGIKNPRQKALNLIKSGKAYKKLKQIIEAQGGSPNIKAEDIQIGPHCVKVKAIKSGKIWWISNHAMKHIAKEAGAPTNKGAGIFLHKKLGDVVKKGDTLFEIYAEKNYKLNRALKLASTLDIMGIGERYEMTMAKIPEEKHERVFILER